MVQCAVSPVGVAALAVFIAAALLEEESGQTAHTRRDQPKPPKTT